MKKIILVSAFFLVLINGCTKPELEEMTPIDLGTKSTSTSIKSINQNGNLVNAVFSTTVGAKYSVQIIPFGAEIPVRQDGFTATSEATEKQYDLSGLDKKDYDLIFIDINGKEVKYPIIIK